MLPSFQRAVRRKTPSLVVLVAISGLLALLTPPSSQTGLFALALVVFVLAVAAVVFAWLPLGGRGGRAAPSADEQPPTQA